MIRDAKVAVGNDRPVFRELQTEALDERRGFFAGRPYHGARLEPSAVFERNAGRIDTFDILAGADVDAAIEKLTRSLLTEALGQMLQQPVFGLYQRNLGLMWIDAWVVAQDRAQKCRELSCDLDPGETAAHDDEA